MKQDTISPEWLNSNLKDLELQEHQRLNEQVMTLESDNFNNFLGIKASEIKLVFDKHTNNITYMRLQFAYSDFTKLLAKLTLLYKQPLYLEYFGTKDLAFLISNQLLIPKKLWQWSSEKFSLNLRQNNNFFEIEIFNS